MTTEHFTLQGARTAAITESTSRATIFIGSVSAGLVALGLIATATRIGTAFYAFGLILLSTLSFMGFVTLDRVLQSGIEELHYAERIARLRAYYFDFAPELTHYLASVPPSRRLALLGLRSGGVMSDAAVRLARACDYVNAGTVEFLYEDGEYYFLEMNTRLQVEHPVTEMVTSTDLVKEQIRIAAGMPLQLQQEDMQPHGHAIECRITAEDASADFRPQSGTVERYLPPGGPGVRMDSHLYAGYQVPPHYDSLLAKLIVWAETREAAIARMQRALDEIVIDGITTTIPFLQRLLKHEGFIRGETYTSFIQEEATALEI